MAINGNTLFIATGTSTVPIAGTRSNEILVDGELIEVSSPTQGQWREYIIGRREWSVTVGWLVLTNAAVQKLLYVNQSYTLKFRTTGTAYLTGTAIMTNCKISATRGSLVQGSFTFKGTGALLSVQ